MTSGHARVPILLGIALKSMPHARATAQLPATATASSAPQQLHAPHASQTSLRARHSLQPLRLRQRALVARQRRCQREQAVDKIDTLVCGVQVAALIHAAWVKVGKKGRSVNRQLTRNTHW